MACTLLIGERVVLTTQGGPPEAEFALFDPGDIELASTEPGVVREVGYRTTAAEALRRLQMSGLTLAVALDAAGALLPRLAARYARGPVIRRIVPLFGPCELFESSTFDEVTHRYHGTWLDLAALSFDLELARASALLQAIHLRALLHEIPEETPLALDTREHAMQRRAGERSFKRMSLENVESLPSAIHALAEKLRSAPSPGGADEGPSRENLLQALQARVDICSDPQAHERFVAIEAALAARVRPQRGPLADPEIWAVEEQLSEGNADGVFERIDVLEKRNGRDPATAYLRARAALLTGRESPTVVAEKASALAMSMSSFPEVELLAAEAWTAAGHPKRAAPFARDLIDTPGADDSLRARAVQLLSAVRGTDASSVPPAPGLPPPPPLPPAPPVPQPPIQPIRTVSQTRSYPSVPAASPSPSPPPAARSAPPPMRSAAPTEPEPMYSSQRPNIPAGLGLRPPYERDSDQAFVAPAPVDEPPDVEAPYRAKTEPAPLRDLGRQVGREAYHEVGHEDVTVIAPSARPPPAAFPEGRPSSGPPAQERAPSRPPVKRASSAPPPRRGSAPPPESAPRRRDTLDVAQDGRRIEQRRSSLPQPQRSSDLMRGASQPPFRADSPAAHMHIPKAPPLPHSDQPGLAEELALPPGLQGQPTPANVIPASVIDARIHFTFLARQLGEDYRSAYNIELVADVSGIEAIQSRLLEDYADGELKTEEDVLDVRRHGAFLSEILARSLGAFWVDIAPADLGYWAMVVPPATRVWPFGRILRFIAMGHRERDLVAYFLELHTRAEKG